MISNQFSHLKQNFEENFSTTLGSETLSFYKKNIDKVIDIFMIMRIIHDEQKQEFEEIFADILITRKVML